jgi:hypothetical protein
LGVELKNRYERSVILGWVEYRRQERINDRDKLYPLCRVVQRPDARWVKWRVFFAEREWEVETRLLDDGRDSGAAEGSKIIHVQMSE